MVGPEFIIAIVTIGCLTSLIKTWVEEKNKGEINEQTFNRLAKAFMEHKKEMQERVRNLEAIIAEQDEDGYSQVEVSNSKGSLTNDLKEKSKIRP